MYQDLPHTTKDKKPFLLWTRKLHDSAQILASQERPSSQYSTFLVMDTKRTCSKWSYFNLRVRSIDRIPE